MMQLERKLRKLSKELVPIYGKADTVAGEILRAYTAIAYSFQTSYEHIGLGRGRETCNPPARFLSWNTTEEIEKQIEGMKWLKSHKDYKRALIQLGYAVLGYLEENPMLETQHNPRNMWHCKDCNEDINDGFIDWE